jgi:hypothetical protein
VTLETKKKAIEESYHALATEQRKVYYKTVPHLSEEILMTAHYDSRPVLILCPFFPLISLHAIFCLRQHVFSPPEQKASPNFSIMDVP